MKILVFGESGQVASAIAQCDPALADAQALVERLGSSACDLSRAGVGADAIAEKAPDAVINAAAYTAVDRAEDDRAAAERLNAMAPEELAAAAAKIDAPFIHFSTDYVFAGDAEEPYREADATNPQNVYGATKRDGERGVLDAHKDAVVIRTSWVFSEFGANFVKTMLRLGGERDRLSIVADQIGGPTPARALAEAALSIAGKKRRGARGAGVYHLQGRPLISWADFAEDIFARAELVTTVEKIPTRDYPTPATRPLNGALDCAAIERDFGVASPDWRADLERIIPLLR